MSRDTVFVAAAAKTLSAVEVDRRASNQHELAAGPLRRMLVDHGLMPADANRFEVVVTVLGLLDDEEPEPTRDTLTVYDARHANPDRGPEWRAYYGAGSDAERIVTSMREGDHLAYTIDRERRVHLLLASAASRWAEVLREALGLEPSPRLTEVPAYELETAQRRAPIDLVADALGIGRLDESDLDWLLSRFGGELPDLPDPIAMATLAHDRVGHEARDHDADTLLERWLTAETDLFMLLERAEGERRISRCEDFEDHVATVLSILQRRKVRRGRSLELHLEALFTARGLPYERQVETEPGSTSDFILPGLAAYRQIDPATPDGPGVLHLGAKSTARERWKQVLSEAGRLRRRHLATLDPQLSHASLRSMAEHDVVPVMPRRLADLYHGHAVMTVEGFIEHARWVISSGARS